MTTAAKRVITFEGPRWSSATICARQASYQGLEAPAEAPSPETERMFRRGRYIGRAIWQDVLEMFREEGRRPRSEEEVPWPADDPVGVGHMDVYVPHEKLAIEVVSTKDCALPEHKALQVAGYVKNHPRAEFGGVLSVDPSTFEEKWYPVNVAGLIPKVEAIEAAVVAALRGGELPERVAEHPGDWPCLTCPFKRHCWEGVEYQPGRLEGHQAVLQRLADIQDRLALGGRQVKELEAEREELRASLRPWVEPGREHVTGGIRLKVTPVAGRRTLSIGDLEKAGHSVPAPLEPFISVGKGYDRWTIRRVG